MDSNKIYEGIVCFFSAKKGYGFLNWDLDGVPQKDLFVHYSGLNVPGFKTVKKGQKVNFKIGINMRNQPIAVDVTTC